MVCLSPLFLTLATCLSPSLWHCVLCQLPLELALISGKSTVRICYVQWCYIVIFTANIRRVPLKCIQQKSVEMKLKLRPADCLGLQWCASLSVSTPLLELSRCHWDLAFIVLILHGIYSFVVYLACFLTTVRMIKEYFTNRGEWLRNGHDNGRC